MVELNAGALSAQIIAERSEACMLNPYNQGDIEPNPVVHFKEMLPNKIKCSFLTWDNLLITTKLA